MAKSDSHAAGELCEKPGLGLVGSTLQPPIVRLSSARRVAGCLPSFCESSTPPPLVARTCGGYQGGAAPLCHI